MLFLLYAYLPEHYKNSTGSKRKVFVRFGIEKIGINKFEFYTVLFLGKATVIYEQSKIEFLLYYTITLNCKFYL